MIPDPLPAIELNAGEASGAKASAARAARATLREPADPEEDLERIEAYTSRFARVVDLLTNKLLRALFGHELEPAESMLDRLTLAEKRGFVEDVEELRLLKENRNAIAHDYAGKEMEAVFAFCRDGHAALEAICDRVDTYSRRLLGESTF